MVRGRELQGPEAGEGSSGHAAAPRTSQSPRAAPGVTVLDLQRSAGNRSVWRLLGGAGRALVQRHPLTQDERTKLEDELRVLNGSEINALLGSMAAKDADTRAHYLELVAGLAGETHEERLRVCIHAVQSKGTAAADFALAHQDDLTAVKHIDQIDAILGYVGGAGFRPPPLKPGDQIATNLGKDGAIVRESTVRVRKDAALTWMAANPGAIGEAPAFKLPGAYAGKTVGGAKLAVFPTDAAGQQGQRDWIRFNAGRGVTVGGFISLYAPTTEQLIERKKQAKKADLTPGEIAAITAATAGNDPKKYLERVAAELGEPAGTLSSKALSAVDHAKLATAMKNVEKWVVGKEQTFDEAIADTTLPKASRFRLLYAKWSR